MTGTTSSTPELQVLANHHPIQRGATVSGRGSLIVRLTGQEPGSTIRLQLGEATAEGVADDSGTADWIFEDLLGRLAGTVTLQVGEHAFTFRVNPEKLARDAITALLAELEEWSAGIGADPGGLWTAEGGPDAIGDFRAMEQAVGLASSAAAGIARRPIHRINERVWAVADHRGPKRPADLRWLATHPAAAARAQAGGKTAGLRRVHGRELDTLENRGVLSAYDRISSVLDQQVADVRANVDQIRSAVTRREDLLGEANPWTTQDQHRLASLARRLDKLDALNNELRVARARTGLPDLRPRSPTVLRTPHMEAEPAYWATLRAFLLAEQVASRRTPPSPTAFAGLERLWEIGSAIRLLSALEKTLGPPTGRANLRQAWGTEAEGLRAAEWRESHRVVRLHLEPTYAYRVGSLRKLHPGRPWRPDLVVEVVYADGTQDLHIFDAKFQVDPGGHAPQRALEEVWWKYGESIGDSRDAPIVRSVWVLWPGHSTRLVGPAMLRPFWPVDRLRGGAVGWWPGRPAVDLDKVVSTILDRTPTIHRTTGVASSEAP